MNKVLVHKVIVYKGGHKMEKYETQEIEQGEWYQGNNILPMRLEGTTVHFGAFVGVRKAEPPKEFPTVAEAKEFMLSQGRLYLNAYSCVVL